MMMLRRLSVAIALSTGLAACYPVEQAALVYSSSDQIGASVVAGTPETPGLVINLGYRSLNAAYVPVAVAKHCPPGSQAECEHLTYQLQRLAGANRLGTFSSSDRDTMDQLRTAIATGEQRRDGLRAAIERDLRQKERAEGAPARRQSLESEQASLAAAAEQRPPEAETRLAQVRAELTALDSLEPVAAIDTRLGANREELGRIETTLQADRQRLDALVRAQELRSDDTTDDAYSVFGSFNGRTQADPESAGLAAGQIFSTGVAAQHLTRGARESAIATACFGAVGELARELPEAERRDFIQDAIAVCRQRDGDRGLD